MRYLDDLRVNQQTKNMLRYAALFLDIDALYRPVVQGVAQQENPEVRMLGVFVQPALGQVRTAVGLDVKVHCPHAPRTSLSSRICLRQYWWLPMRSTLSAGQG